MDTIFSRLEFLQKNKEKQKRWNISWQLASFISNFIKIHQPKNILEIGTSNGFSTLAISRFLDKNESKIITIEVDKTRFHEAKINFDLCKLDNIEQILGNALEIVPKLNEKFDLIFMDAGQMYYKKLVEDIILNDLIKKEGYIICDNVKTHDKMDDFIEFMKKEFKCELLEFDSGFLIAKK